KSQGFGAARQRGNVIERFEVLAGDAPENTLFDGIETSWKRLGGGEDIAQRIAEIEERFDMAHPEKSIDALLVLLDRVSKMEDNHWKSIKVNEIKDLILACGGIWFESLSPVSQLAVNEQTTIGTSYIVRRPGVKVTVDGHE